MKVLIDIDVDDKDPEELLEEIEEALRDAGLSAVVDFFDED
jgi:predicted TIM-barrel fold metal-dependent hydrolase